MATDRSYTAQHTGPIVLDLRQDTGVVVLSVNPTAQHATATITTSADEGVSADSVNDAKITENGGQLNIAVKTPGGSSGSINIVGGDINFSGSNYNFSSVSMSGGGRIIVNGVDVTAAVNAGAKTITTITTTVILPADSEVLLSTKSAEVTVNGELKALDVSNKSGSLTAGTIGDLDADMTSGSLRVGEITGRLNVNMTSGNLGISAYSGTEARINMTSGNASINATPASRGRFSFGMTSGNGRITGTSHLNVRRNVTSGSLHVS